MRGPFQKRFFLYDSMENQTLYFSMLLNWTSANTLATLFIRFVSLVLCGSYMNTIAERRRWGGIQLRIINFTREYYWILMRKIKRTSKGYSVSRWKPHHYCNQNIIFFSTSVIVYRIGLSLKGEIKKSWNKHFVFHLLCRTVKVVSN